MRIVSLFSGAGGLDFGLIGAGHKVVWANDIDLDAVTTYRKNIGDHVVHHDISGVESSTIPTCDAIVGGFPCQGFSQANLLRFNDDARNRLYLEFLRIVEDKQPAFFLAENVRGILSLAGGKAIAKIIEDFSAAGYRVDSQLFDVANYGVPQRRHRVIIAGTRSDLPLSMNFQFPQATHAMPSKAAQLGLKRWRTIVEALTEIPEPDAPHNFLNHIYSGYKVTNRNFTGHRTTDPSKPSPTILARGNGKGGVCAIQHPRNHRRMSVREQAAVQTFPHDFEFVGSMNSCYRQVGNAVPVLFARFLGECLVRSTSFKKTA